MEDNQTRELIKLYRKKKSEKILRVLMNNHEASISFVINLSNGYVLTRPEMFSLGRTILFNIIKKFDLRHKIKFNTYFINILKFRIIDEQRARLKKEHIISLDDGKYRSAIMTDTGVINAYEEYEQKELKDNIIKVITKLPRVEQTIITHVYEGGKMIELAEQLDLSVSRISQIHKSAVRGLRTKMLNYI